MKQRSQGIDTKNRRINTQYTDWFAQAFEFHQAGEKSKAEELYVRVLKHQPKHINALLNLGSIRREQQRQAEAVTLYNTALAEAPDNIHLHRNIANALCDLGRYPEAEPHVRQVLADGSDDLNTRLQLLSCCVFSHRAQEALEQALILVERTEAKEPGLLKLLAHAYLRLYQVDPAREALNRALEITPRDKEARFLLSVLDDRINEVDYLEFTRTSYDATAPTYDSVIAPTLQNRTADLLFDLLRDHTSPSEPFGLVVDLGCGGGRMGKLVAPLSKHLIGVDLSPAMIELCRDRGIYDELYVADINSFELDPNTPADLFVCSDALVHVGDIGPFLANSRSRSAPNGKLLFSIELEDGTGMKFDLSKLRYLHSQNYVERILDEYGYRIIELRRKQIRIESSGAIMGLLVLCETAE